MCAKVRHIAFGGCIPRPTLHLRGFEERRAVLRKLVGGRAERVESDSELSCEHAAVRALRRFRERHACDEVSLAAVA